MAQLYSHSGGLDDAGLLEGQSFQGAMDILGDRALMTVPGVIYSRSRYSYPLAIRVLEKVARQPFQQAVAAAIFRPLGMDRSTFDLEEAPDWGLVPGWGRSTEAVSPFRPVEPEREVGGIPVLFTTTGDLLTLLVAWMEGGVRGTPPWASAHVPVEEAFPGDRGLRAGIFMDGEPGYLRVRRTGSALGYGGGFYLFPSERAALLTWGIGARDSGTVSLAQERVVAAFQSPEEAPEVEGDMDW